MTKLYKFQEKAVRKISHFDGRALLADEMGLGKTLEALQWLAENPELRPAVVVCPANIKWVWETQAVEHVSLRADILQGKSPPRKRLTNSHPILILNYEILQYWFKYIRRLQPKVLLLDECHYIKNLRAIRTRKARKLSKRVPHIIGISGTPLTNRPWELFPILNILRPDKFPSPILFAFRYCKPRLGRRGTWEYKGATNLKELHNRLNRLCMIRRLKKDVIKELPDKIRQVIPLPIEKKKDYQEAADNFLRWLRKISKAKAHRAKKAQQLVQLGYLKRLAAELKMKAVLEWVDSFLEESSGKLVLYCCHKKIIKILRERYKNICVVIEGGTPTKKRKLIVKSFQTKKKKRLFIGNIRAAGVGITLTAASTLAFVELDWVPGNHTQAEDRIHRIGQKNAAVIYYLIARGTIEEDLCRIIQKKQINISKILDGKKKTADKLEVFNMLEKKLKGKLL
jgi:SNF2 family DNA or RNA helicase